MENKTQGSSPQRASPQASSPQRNRRTALGRKHTASRELVLRELELRGPSTVGELAARTDLHENTVRGHLAALHTDGHVRQDAAGAGGADPAPQSDAKQVNATAKATAAAGYAAAPKRGRGRPTRVWSAVPAEALHPYAGLALTLANALGKAHPNAKQLARNAGIAWGEKLAAERAEANSGSPDGSARDLALTIMREQGFAPDELGFVPDADSPEGSAATGEKDADFGALPITLRRCPLLAAASERSDVVCAVHEGMIAGITGSQTPGTKVQLLPFVSPGTCLLHVQADS